MELNDKHVVLPQETFTELSSAAYTDPTVGERVASTVQTTFVFGALAAGVTAAAFGVAKATDWLEERRWKRDDRRHESKTAPTQS